MAVTFNSKVTNRTNYCNVREYLCVDFDKKKLVKLH